MDDEINACYERLLQAVAEMNEWIKVTSEYAVVYRLPIVTDRSIPNVIPSQELKGKDAVAEALSAYSRLNYMEDQSSGTAYRLPGVVFVNSDDGSRVANVNREKDDLKKLVLRAAPEKHKRLKLCRALFKGLSMSQIYRNIVQLNSDVQSIRFTWMTHSVGATRLSVKEARDLVGKNIRAEDGLGNKARVQALEITLEKLSSFDASTSIVRRRPVPPHPRANVVRATGAKQEKANLPFIVNSTVDAMDIGALGTFDLFKKRPQRSDKLKIKPLHPGLGLHLVED